MNYIDWVKLQISKLGDKEIVKKDVDSGCPIFITFKTLLGETKMIAIEPKTKKC